MINELEIWKDIINYEGLYKVSNLGNIKSFYRSSEGKRYYFGSFINEKDAYNAYLEGINKISLGLL